MRVRVKIKVAWEKAIISHANNVLGLHEVGIIQVGARSSDSLWFHGRRFRFRYALSFTME